MTEHTPLNVKISQVGDVVQTLNQGGWTGRPYRLTRLSGTPILAGLFVTAEAAQAWARAKGYVVLGADGDGGNGSGLG